MVFVSWVLFLIFLSYFASYYYDAARWLLIKLYYWLDARHELKKEREYYVGVQFKINAEYYWDKLWERFIWDI